MKTNLKQLRKDAGWSNADDFARSISMSPKTYRNYEQGVRKLGLDTASEICNALGCSINDLVTSQTEYALVDLPKDVDISDDERELIRLYRSITKYQKAGILFCLSQMENNDYLEPSTSAYGHGNNFQSLDKVYEDGYLNYPLDYNEAIKYGKEWAMKVWKD